MDKFSNSPNRDSPIAIFDSGVGGLTVFKAIADLLPTENLIYFGDTARVPYGNRSGETVKKFVDECIQFLMQYHVKALVLACNTATAHAEEMLKQALSIPIIGVIEPGVEKLVATTQNRHVCVIATKGTLKTNVYQSLIEKRLENGIVHTIACPLFVPLVEEGLTHHPLTRLAVNYYLESLKSKKIDTILLGCTHYPFIKDLIRECMGNDVQIIDSATTCAFYLNQILMEYELKSTKSDLGQHRFIVTDDAENFAATAKKLGIPMVDHLIEEIDLVLCGA